MDLMSDIKKRPLVASHRGVAGGNIPGNTIDAFEAALFQGADMLELDVDKSTDGVLYVFHPRTEPSYIGSYELIEHSPSKRVDQMVFRNTDGLPTRHHILKLDEFFEQFKNRCYLNIDKFWMWIPEIAAAVRRHNMEDQVLCKIPNEPKFFDAVEAAAPDMPFVVMTHEKDEISGSLLKRKLSYRGVEALFTTDDAPIASPQYVEYMHKNGLLIFTNAIVYSYQVLLSGIHSDDISIVGQPDIGWGWHADRGFDIIQTDWPCAMVKYLENTGRRARK